MQVERGPFWCSYLQAEGFYRWTIGQVSRADTVATDGNLQRSVGMTGDVGKGLATNCEADTGNS